VKQNTYDTIIIGAGASGIVAGIVAARAGASVLICDRLAHIAKKVLASGGGKCNLLNDRLSAEFYQPAARSLVETVFGRFGKQKILAFFESLGLFCYQQDGRYFPVTNQASSVVAVLRRALESYHVSVVHDCAITKVSKKGECFVVSGSGHSFSCRRLIIAGGGKSYPALGSDGSCYVLAKQLGHTITEPVPVVVPLVVKDPLCHVLQGLKIDAEVTGFAGGRQISCSRGDLLFTQYGLSGTAVLDASTEISIAGNRHKSDDVYAVVDFAPWMDKQDLVSCITSRLQEGWQPQELLIGIVPNKMAQALGRSIIGKKPDEIADIVKKKRFVVSGTRGWNEAEFTAGGIRPQDLVAETLESRVCPGVYFCGEIVDVGGRRGGYNLAWAWASGYVAGMSK
jgi:predicted Rossmann fold flavoprotein